MNEHPGAAETSTDPGPRHRTADMARALGVTHWQLWKAVASGRIAAEREGRCWVITEDPGSVARKLGAAPPPPLKAA